MNIPRKMSQRLSHISRLLLTLTRLFEDQSFIGGYFLYKEEPNEADYLVYVDKNSRQTHQVSPGLTSSIKGDKGHIDDQDI